MAQFNVLVILVKFLVAVMFINTILFSQGVRSKQFCPGPCKQFPNCDAYCKSHGYQIGQCVSPQNYFCCCAKADQVLG